jgi:hypothetical protein
LSLPATYAHPSTEEFAIPSVSFVSRPLRGSPLHTLGSPPAHALSGVRTRDRVRDLLPEEADRLLKNRFAEINVWRAIRGPIESSPLALCDARSLGTEDIVPIDLVYRERVGEIYGFLYNPKHRWYYFPRLERSEPILLKCYDSMDDGRARFTAHTSFEDPSSPPNAAPRESIEVRALVFWPADQ